MHTRQLAATNLTSQLSSADQLPQPKHLAVHRN
jgi:hypothetical protein